MAAGEGLRGQGHRAAGPDAADHRRGVRAPAAAAGHACPWVAFFVVETLVLVCAFTGIGLWVGAAYPNFDESRGGTPDVMSMFLMSLLCLGVAVLILGIGGLALAGPPIGFRWGGLANGVLVMVLSLEVGLALLLWGVLRAAKRYGALEVRFS